MTRTQIRHALIAAVLSFLPYASPPFVRGKPALIAAWLDLAGRDPWGESRFHLLIEVPGGLESLLPAVAIGISILGQVGLFLVLLRLLRVHRIVLRAAAIGATAFGFVFVIAAACETLLPVAFRVVEPLIVRARRPLPEKASWPAECGDTDYEIEQFVHTPPSGILGTRGQLWVRNRSTKRIGFMRRADCRIEETEFTEDDFLISRFYATVEGRSIFVKSNQRGDPEQWWFSKGPQAKPVPIARPSNTDDPWPVLSDDGRWVAWVAPTNPDQQQVVLQNVETSETRTISSKLFASDRLRMMGYDAQRSEVLVARQNYEQAWAVRSSDGYPTLGPIQFGDRDWKESVIERVLRRGDGWVVWYGRPKPTVVQWSLRGVERLYRVPSGTQINSVDVSPDGSLIAIGTDGDFAGSSIESAACVLSAGTGEEVFRKYFSRRSWVKVAFLGNDRLEYSARASGFLLSGSALRVVRIAR